MLTLRLLFLSLILASLLLSGCDEKLLVTYVNNTSETVRMSLNADDSIVVEPGETIETSYSSKSAFDEPYRIIARSLDGRVVLDLTMTDDELEAMDNRIVIDPR